ncbi:hypothetical protein CANARDRAFT_29640 [[Candida] arabinofermentans NRRL YB-2248]|uniref:TLC domain-containing protein n=1 Tax=[Candida] arabinofermentans NRRL YB-2248 TaxID=983967 RepID=A0A1E4SWP3_9ASCO|nr:hypothetical protein CANARDRAFT_29640 [[Candida] arabinofermentans NRRL YB-2248]
MPSDKNPNTLSPPQARTRRRQSSVGNIDLGDNAVPGLQTMQSSEDVRATSSVYNQQLNNKTDGSNDMAILGKIWVSIKLLSYRNTWLIPLILLSIPQALYWSSNNYTPSNPLHMFVQLSYEIEGTSPSMYGKGWKDLGFLFYMMIFFTFYREFLMKVILKPIARHFGIKKEGKLNRFMEQTYSICYYGVSGPLGLYIMKGMPLWYFNTSQFYIDYPHLSLEHLFKFYYLSQASFWAQQSVVLMLQLEKPRKDFHELVFHHIITMLLIALSYTTNYTWMGLAIYITMDISDFFLACSKTLNYLDSPITGPFFVLFVGVWFYLRHWINLRILWSIVFEFHKLGPYHLDFSTGHFKCWISQPIVFFLIFCLQLVNLYWFFLVLRILYRYVFLDVTKDERSDSEEDENETKKDE